MLFAVDEQKRDHTVVYIVWDELQTCYLIGGGFLNFGIAVPPVFTMERNQIRFTSYKCI